MSYIASLPWYDLPQTHTAVDQFWNVLATALQDHALDGVPATLDRNTPLPDQWALSRLLLSQCCGPDLKTTAAQQLSTIARPVFSDLDCTPGSYFSHIVASRPYLGGTARLAANALSSRSGYGALIEWTQKHAVPVEGIAVTGSHAASLQALREGRADLAAIDAHSWNLLQVDDLHIIDHSSEALAPPYVMHCSNNRKSDKVAQALAQAIDHAGHLIGIKGVLKTTNTDYSCRQATSTLPPVVNSSVQLAPPLEQDRLSHFGT